MTAALSDSQLWAIVTGAGFAGQEAVKAVAVFLAESGGVPDITHKNSNGTIDYGIAQINSVHTDLLSGKQWSDPVQNVGMAKTLYDAAGGKFTPWAAYNNGSYARFLARAQAVSNGVPAVDAPAGNGSDSLTTSASSLPRIGLYLAGGLLLFIAIVSLVKNTSVVKTVSHVAKVAAVA